MDARTKRLIDEWLGLSLNGWIVESYINSGKSALVFRGAKDGVTAAIKIFDPEIIERFGEKDEAERIKRELELVGMHHNNLVRIFDGGQSAEHNLFFVVMEFIDAPNLATVLAEVPPERIPEIIAQLASAAQFLHERGIVHRDIKPDNIAITADFQRIVLLDLGVIRPYEQSGTEPLTDREKKIFIGTLQYSSPEYLLREEESGQDGAIALTFYQMGAVLHDLLMKKRIFADYTDPYARLVQAVLHDVPQIESTGKPVYLMTLAKNCLLKKPDLRLKLVAWRDFSVPSNPDMTATAKERIRKRKILATYESTSEETTEDGWEAEQKRITQLTSLLSRLADSIREECTEGELPPRSVKEASDEHGKFGSVEVHFKEALRSGLMNEVLMRFTIEILDHHAQAISLQCVALANPEAKPESASPALAVPIFDGVYDDLAIRDSVVKVLFPIIADAMELPLNAGYAALFINI